MHTACSLLEFTWLYQRTMDVVRCLWILVKVKGNLPVILIHVPVYQNFYPFSKSQTSSPALKAGWNYRIKFVLKGNKINVCSNNKIQFYGWFRVLSCKIYIYFHFWFYQIEFGPFLIWHQHLENVFSLWPLTLTMIDLLLYVTWCTRNIPKAI